MSLYCSNISYNSSKKDFCAFLENAIGPVAYINWIVTPIGTGVNDHNEYVYKFEGYCFVDFVDPKNDVKAITVLNGQKFDNCSIRVAEAVPRRSRKK